MQIFDTRINTQIYSSKLNSVLSNLYPVENGAALYKITNKEKTKILLWFAQAEQGIMLFILAGWPWWSLIICILL